MTILEKLRDLHLQATKERSHFYVGSVCDEAAIEIAALRTQLHIAVSALKKIEAKGNETLTALKLKD